MTCVLDLSDRYKDMKPDISMLKRLAYDLVEGKSFDCMVFRGRVVLRVEGVQIEVIDLDR